MTEPKTFAEWLPEIDFAFLPYPALVAGGALRDSWFGREVNDVDLFIGVSAALLTDCWTAKKFAVNGHGVTPVNYLRFAGARPKFINFEVDFDGEYDAGDFVSGRSTQKPGLNVILFVMPEGSGEKELADALFEKFPCSISRIAWSPRSDEWFICDSFKHSEATRVIEFHANADTMVGGKYYKKIFPKYDGWEHTYSRSSILSWLKSGI